MDVDSPQEVEKRKKEKRHVSYLSHEKAFRGREGIGRFLRKKPALPNLGRGALTVDHHGRKKGR